MRNIVESKVKTGSLAATVTAFVMTEVQPYLPDALGGTLDSIISTAVTGLATFGAAWLTRHTPRVEVEAVDQ
ncbi:hypothetical protein SAMN04487905_10610 [Actinopolyspora xinjiangensis]|uniref:Phage r1t holin n=1 Tax=Actinopolyspora xinjiangensis TaxID=405564 RepID=A0A1H0U3E2_9ACTN|nr:hypothetical protein [Actinopolyspora xinjiangensis]SDP60468.1 hypothetical protein SAMN04487905_10610 [Actinopolyspora xinjiangensis]